MARHHLLVSGARKLANFFSPTAPAAAWVETAFRDFIAVDGHRAAMLATCAWHVGQVVGHFERWRDNREGDAELAAAVLAACAHLDRRHITHRTIKFRSYVDVALQVLVLRILVDHLAARSQAGSPLEPLQLTALLLHHQPDSRPALLVHADLQLEAGRIHEAVDTVQRALRIQAVCITAQQLLFRAYQAQRDSGSDAPELAVLDYDLSDKFCPMPFTHMSTGFKGETFACTCPAWVPFSIGNALEADSAEAVWNSDVAREIRRSVLDGDFSYCSRTQCSFIAARKLPKRSEITRPRLRAYIDGHVTRVDDAPEMVELNHDPTCNLACPSCRTEIIAAKSDDIDEFAGATSRVFLPLLKRVTGHTYITGGGEAFSSQHFRSILRSLNRTEFPGLQVYLITNGLLLTPSRWESFPDLGPMLATVAVSVDAARAATYEKLRRPAKWEKLTRNLEFLASLRRDRQIPHLQLNFVVQKDNFREMLEFVDLADRLGADAIWFQRVVNYGSYDQAAFAGIDVTTPTHPDHAELLGILRDPRLRRPTIDMTMLLSLVPEFVAANDRIEYLY